MATGTTQSTQSTQEPLAGHDQGPIVRDKLYIGGEWVDPSGDGVLEVIDSTTEQVMGSVPEGTAEDLDRAVAAARAAFDAWSTTPVDERVAACSAIAQQLAARSAEIAALISREVGMPIELATMIQAASRRGTTRCTRSARRWRPRWPRVAALS
jgi:acyl-CoA reductase-like NAD-dependent aldehyde dehydrogenase